MLEAIGVEDTVVVVGGDGCGFAAVDERPNAEDNDADAVATGGVRLRQRLVTVDGRTCCRYQETG